MNFLTQSKLNQNEWLSIEKPITNKKEMSILKMISQGYDNENYRISNSSYLNNYLKVGSSYDKYTYFHLFQSSIKQANENNVLCIKTQYLYNTNEIFKVKGKSKLPKDVVIKVNNSIDKLMRQNHRNIIEFRILENIQSICKYLKKYGFDSKKCFQHKKVCLAFYNLNFLIVHHKSNIHTIIRDICNEVLSNYLTCVEPSTMLQNVSSVFESNDVHDTVDNVLHNHQKHIYGIFKIHKEPKLVMYCAPTSSGKTLTPLGLCNEYKVIFVCASKHIGLTLAKCAFSIGKNIGFAFGCNDTDHIRLNYNAVNSWIESRDGRKRPDHSDGEKVELMITDLKSYEYAMLYMKAFNKVENMVMFWDEPTIGLDVEKSPMHETIAHNWKINKIPNVILSCATLPKQHQIQGIVIQHEERFGPNIYFEYIDVYDQYTNLMIYDGKGHIVMPHNQFTDIKKLHQFMIYQHKKYFKFYDCQECANFILYYNSKYDSKYINNNFKSFDDITISKIKYAYYKLLLSIDDQNLYTEIIDGYKLTENVSDLCISPEITTRSAHTLSNGPTLYMTNNIEKVSKYLLHIS